MPLDVSPSTSVFVGTFGATLHSFYTVLSFTCSCTHRYSSACVDASVAGALAGWVNRLPRVQRSPEPLHAGRDCWGGSSRPAPYATVGPPQVLPSTGVTASSPLAVGDVDLPCWTLLTSCERALAVSCLRSRGSIPRRFHSRFSLRQAVAQTSAVAPGS